MIILLLLLFLFHITHIIAINTCEKYNITHSIQNDSVIISFASNNLLKLDRNIRCRSPSSFTAVNGCTHHCTGLDFGQSDVISVEMHHENNTMETCSIDYLTPLQAPSLASLNIVNNKVRLGINRPFGSFDYVEVFCLDQESYVIFNTSIPSNNSIATVDCSFFLNMTLMNFVFRTIKQRFYPVADGISREVPLPIFFTHLIDQRVLTIIADAPPPMNIPNHYEFQLLFHDEQNESITYEREKQFNLNSKESYTFNYGLIPYLQYTIIFKHFAPSIGYAQSNRTIPPIVNISYPFAVTNLRLKEEFNTIIINWEDNHDRFDPIEYIVLCNSRENLTKNVGRNTTCTCEQMTFNETNIISVQTQVVMSGYAYERKAIAQIDVSQIPDIPMLEIENTTENSIAIRWNWNNNQSAVLSNSFRYRINCSLDYNVTEIDIQSNEYQCQSLVPGTLYIITIYLENIDGTIQRSKSIQANTLLEKCQYNNHFYSPDFNGTRFVIIEWSPPEKNFNEIHVHCPSSYMIFEPSQIMPIMFVKCLVTNGIQFTVTFVTFKSGYEWGILEMIATPPIDSMTTVGVVTQDQSTTSSEGPPTVTAADCLQDDLEENQAAMTRWRIVAIVAFIVAGFLVILTVGLTILSVLLYSRNRYGLRHE